MATTINFHSALNGGNQLVEAALQSLKIADGDQYAAAFWWREPHYAEGPSQEQIEEIRNMLWGLPGIHQLKWVIKTGKELYELGATDSIVGAAFVTKFNFMIAIK